MGIMFYPHMKCSGDTCPRLKGETEKNTRGYMKAFLEMKARGILAKMANSLPVKYKREEL